MTNIPIDRTPVLLTTAKKGKTNATTRLFHNMIEIKVKLEWAASNGNRYPQVMVTAISQ